MSINLYYKIKYNTQYNIMYFFFDCLLTILSIAGFVYGMSNLFVRLLNVLENGPHWLIYSSIAGYFLYPFLTEALINLGSKIFTSDSQLRK